MPHVSSHDDAAAVSSQTAVTVRMYNQGFGDCLLITMRASDGSPRYLLIDCGVHHQYSDHEFGDRADRMRAVAADIAKVTNGHLDAVAITHQHTDHLYGFKYAKEVFTSIDIDQLWLAWTEDPDDPVANELKRTSKRAIAELGASIERVRGANPALAMTLDGLLGFEAMAADGTSAELDFLRQHCKKSPHRPEDYLRPGGRPPTLPGVTGVNFYVMGPPRKTSDIRTLTREREMYPEVSALNRMGPFLSAFGIKREATPDDDTRFQVNCPFEESLEIPFSAAAGDKAFGDFFRESYGFEDTQGHGPSWQRIEDDWTAPISELALNIDNLTNNTTLVLALELATSDPPKAMLFAGDAQVGSWLSWGKVEFDDSRSKTKITGEDILRRTVLYKVGHHGSRNATLKQHGLEMMDSSELVAILPVDEEWARSKMRWEHPAPNLLANLKQKAKNRVLRTDRIHLLPTDLVKPDDYRDEEWKEFLGRVKWDPTQALWVEYTLGP